VRHVGQIVAMVIAESVNEAKDAAEMIEIDYVPLPVQTDPVTSNTPDAPLLWEDCILNEAFVSERGNAEAAEAALKAASHVVRDTFTVSRVTANAMAHHDDQGGVQDSRNPDDGDRRRCRRVIRHERGPLSGGAFGSLGGAANRAPGQMDL
jgi:carbon-monoxide dehydrogenase large subunit